ncbi:hypothetical protein [Halapricum desulfuricans]|uniref:Uncharacterized protein n=1 Tax=Halapricum desulfuricans TaxID=2841257 RepID=A0A897MZA8_9EURY|nr:hypothetical protein [Halapricum desulfuricans]QSG05328.1 hypothetical protein HSR121_0980 [Halapricum desulfuricans]
MSSVTDQTNEEPTLICEYCGSVIESDHQYCPAPYSSTLARFDVPTS